MDPRRGGISSCSTTGWSSRRRRRRSARHNRKESENMRISKRYLLAGGALAVALLAWRTFFAVRETEFVLVAQFGKPVRTIETAGLHAKWFFQSAYYFDRRL